MDDSPLREWSGLIYWPECLLWRPSLDQYTLHHKLGADRPESLVPQRFQKFRL